MKKLETPLRIVLPPVGLHIDDVDEILEIMKEVPDNPVLHIVADGWELEDAADLEEKLPTKIGTDHVAELHVKVIEVSHSGASVCLDIQGKEVTLTAPADTVVYRGVLSKLREVLRPRVRKLTTEDENTSMAIVALGVLGLALVINGITGLRLDLFASGLILSGVGVFVWLKCRKTGSVVLLRRRAGQKSFWQRNRDQILLHLFTSGSSAIIGAIAGYLMAKLG